MHFTFADFNTLLSAIAALIAAYHAARANRKGTQIRANVNGNLESLIQILAESAITIPHDTATRVISAPPVQHAADETPEERVAMEFFAKINPRA